jgi:hypothetical protein
MMGVPSKLNVIRKVVVFVRDRPILFFNWTETAARGGSGIIHNLIVLTKLLKLYRSGQFPDESPRIRVGQIHYVTCLMY